MTHCTIAARNFSKPTLRALTKKGVTIIGSRALPDASGSYLNSVVGYQVSDNGTGKKIGRAHV